jgi:hypothetical protein
MSPEAFKLMANQTGNVPSIERHVKELEKVYIEAIDDVATKGQVEEGRQC